MPSAHADKDGSKAIGSGRHRGMRTDEGAQLSQAILQCATRCLGKLSFLHEISDILMDYCACDAIELRLSDHDLHYRWHAARRPKKATKFEHMQWILAEDGCVIPATEDDSDLEQLCRDVAQQCLIEQPFFTSNGSFWTGDAWQSMLLETEPGPRTSRRRLGVAFGPNLRVDETFGRKVSG